MDVEQSSLNQPPAQRVGPGHEVERRMNPARGIGIEGGSGDVPAESETLPPRPQAMGCGRGIRRNDRPT